MLRLRRKKNQAILIGNDIRIVVLQIDAHDVHIGISAPANVEIWREEIAQQQKESNDGIHDSQGPSTAS